MYAVQVYRSRCFTTVITFPTKKQAIEWLKEKRSMKHITRRMRIVKVLYVIVDRDGNELLGPIDES